MIEYEQRLNPAVTQGTINWNTNHARPQRRLHRKLKVLSPLSLLLGLEIPVQRSFQGLEQCTESVLVGYKHQQEWLLLALIYAVAQVMA